jgi:hypothetical protein
VSNNPLFSQLTFRISTALMLRSSYDELYEIIVRIFQSCTFLQYLHLSPRLPRPVTSTRRQTKFISLYTQWASKHLTLLERQRQTSSAASPNSSHSALTRRSSAPSLPLNQAPHQVGIMETLAKKICEMSISNPLSLIGNALRGL